MSRPIYLGLTGSIGMGKSTVAGMFEALGVPVFDADAEVHRMQGPGGSLLPEIELEFPGSTGQEGVKRSELGRRVFSDPEAMARLEAIVHPAVRAAREAFLEKCSDAPLLVFDVPLLFETGQANDFDAVVVVSCGSEIQRERVLSRPDMTIERFEAILEFQMPDEEKRSRATYVIDTSRPLEETKEQVAELIRKLTD